MYLSDILTPELIQTQVEATSKKRLLEHISELTTRNNPELSPTDVFEALLARERLGSTGMGHGVAVPHARLANLDQAVGCLILLKKPIEYDAIDNQPVQVAFGLIVPEQASDSHLQLLADIAEKMNDAALLKQLVTTNDPKDIYHLITKEGTQQTRQAKHDDEAHQSHHS